MPPKTELPLFLNNVVEPAKYTLWLGRKANALIKRDRRRSYSNVSRALYKKAIHAAICKSKGHDAYTNEQLDWKLIGTYNNEMAKKGGHAYKA